MKYILPTSHDKPKYVKEKFGNIAKKYDIFNDIITFGMHRYWKSFLVKSLGIKKNDQCLDLCCGTGDISIKIMQKNPECKITGLDFSPEMLKIASSKIGSQSSINFLLGDAMEIPFSDSNFDAVTISFGLRNVSNIKTCLKEIFRVLKKDGVFVCLDLGKVRMPIISSLNRLYFFKIVPMIGKFLIPGEEMFNYLPSSSLDYPSQESIKNMILEVGFKNVEIHNFVFGASTIHIAYKKK